MLTLEKLQQARGQFDDDTILKAIEKRDPEFGERIRKGREHGFDSATMVQAIEKRLSSLPQQQQQPPQSEHTRAPSGPGLRLLEYAGIPGQLTRYAFKGKKPEAVSFAKEQFQQGKSAEEVTKALRSQDWTENDVNDIMSEIFPHQVPDTGVSKLKPKDIDLDKLSDIQILELTKEQTTKLPVAKRLELVKRMSAAREQEKNAALIGGATFGATDKLREKYGLAQPEYIGEGAKQLMTLAGAAGPFGVASKAFKLSEKGLFSLKSLLGHTALGEIDLTARSLIERGELPKLEELTGMLADVVAFEGLLKGGEKALFKNNINKIAKQQGITDLKALQQVVDQSGINPKTNPQKFTEAVEERAKISKSATKAWNDYLNKKRADGTLITDEKIEPKKTKKADVKAYKEQKKQASQKTTLPEKETADLQTTQKEKLLKRIEEEKAKVAASKAAKAKRPPIEEPKPEVRTTVPTEKSAVASEKPEHRPGEKLELAELRVSQLEKIIKENPRAETAKEQLKQANGNLKEIQEKKTSEKPWEKATRELDGALKITKLTPEEYLRVLRESEADARSNHNGKQADMFEMKADILEKRIADSNKPKKETSEAPKRIEGEITREEWEADWRKKNPEVTQKALDLMARKHKFKEKIEPIQEKKPPKAPEIEQKQAKIEPEARKKTDIKPKKTQKENQASMKKWMDDQWEKKVAKDKLKEDITHENIESLKKEYAKPEEIAFKPDLMQFKRIDEASEGLSHVDEITGDWDTRKAGVITVWEPKNPSEFGLDKKQPYIVVNGHHRLSKAKKSGAENLRIQVLSEADGITAAEARAIGAEINIADGKGTIYDQVKFLREQRKAYSENEALGRAKQTGSKGREATSIAFEATDNTYSAFVDERITPQQTAAIAESAPKNESLQALGLKLALKGKKPQEIKNFVEVAKAAKHKPNVKQGDLFSFDDSAIRSMEALADKVTELQTEVNQRIQSASGAVKRPEKAGNMGVKVENIVETKAKTTKLKELKQRLDKIGTDKDLMDAVKDGVTVDELLAHDKPQDLAFGLGHFNKWLQDKIKASPTEQKGWDLLHRFFGPRWQAEYTSKVKWNLNLKEQFPDPKMREDMIYYREKTGNPFHGRGDTITDVKKRLSPEAKKFVDTEVDQHLDDALADFNATPYVKDINPRQFVQDVYIPHFYEANPAQAKKAFEGVSKRFSTKNPFASKRTFLTYNEALQKQGLVPKFRDIGELMESYDTLLAKIKTSQMIAGELNALQKQTKQTLIVRPGSQKYDAAKAAGWIPFEDPYLRRKYRGLDAEGKQIWTTAEGPSLVQPEIAQALAGVFVREFKRPPLSFLQNSMRNTIAAVQSIDNLVKYWRVTGSLFHVNSLLEGFGAASGQNPIPGMALAKSVKAFKEMGKRMRDPALMAEPLEAGLKVEPPMEATTKGFPLIDKWMKQMELKGGAAKKLATAMRIGGTPVRKFNNFLFGQFHPRLKTSMYFSYKQRALDMYAKEGRVLSNSEMKHLNREIAKMVNNQMGGQRWETIRTLNDPTTRGWLEAGIAYPDWSISALREVQDAFSQGMRGKLSRGYLSRYVSQLFMSAQIFNYGFTGLTRNSAGNIEWDSKKAKFTWQNDDPKKAGLFDIQLPDVEFKIPGVGDINFGKDEKGRNLYFHQGKKLFEIGKYFTDPVQEVFSKSRPVIQWAWGQAAGYSPSGFPIRGGYGPNGQFSPWKGTKPNTLARAKERAIHTAEFAVPFAFGSLVTEGPKEAAKRVVSSGGGAVPISKGISLHDAGDYFEKYYRKNDNDGLIALKRVLLRQGYSKKDIERKMSQAKSRAKK